MRLSEFWRLMDDEFSPSYSRVLARDLVLAGVGGNTASDALRAGFDPKEVWIEVCKMQDVPPSRWLGKDIAPKN
ncbi:DUF3046 domain-containing protein [Arthrobacter psychrolactophilus]|uniref:DUF3046 domain-containing protein n=1 Tax=Arthrobacter psychrolactophilus TaxID=92442 RepID=A0A2V5J4W7_9MICC|nr:DUF3046 domain-containing protein [Arthrobacter psychrolactophilus]PYI37450.1 DUF3046 domain-containing protein [Arthrobacter psychrolactophilus]